MKYNYITIERKYASAGSAIGRDLSKVLGIPCYGEEILEMVAKKYNVSLDYLQNFEETTTSSFIYSINMMAQMGNSGSNVLSTAERLNFAEVNIIKELALKGPAIFVGRCAQWALRDRNDVLNIFVHADYESRKKRAMEKYGVEESNIQSVLKKFDKRRSNYFNANTNGKWNDISNYHMVLDSGKVGIQKCVKIIEGLVKDDN